MASQKYNILYGRLSQEDERQGSQTPSTIKSYYVKGGFSHLIHMTAAHLW